MKLKRGLEPPSAAAAPVSSAASSSAAPAAPVVQDADADADDGRKMARVTKYNPAYGNSSRDAAIIILLRKFGFADFRHDFNEKTATRDLITDADLKRFMEILQRYSVDSRVKATATFKNMYKGKTLYDLLRNQIGDVLYPSNTKTTQNPETPGDDLHEEAVMKAVGLEYPTLKTTIKGLGDTPDRKVGTFTFGVTTKRTYIVRAQTYKYNRTEAEKAAAKEEIPDTRNLSSLFMDVTGGKTKFAVIIDATGGLSTTSFADSRLFPRPPPGTQCEFVIINNIENDADSADKLKRVKAQGTNAPLMKILRDTESTAVYPVWTTDELADGANIFSGVRIILNRTEKGEVEADMFFPDEVDLGGGKKINAGTTYNIGDLSETSNVKNATLNAVATLMMEPNHPGKPFLYALIKRMGDWCQALSLLDRSRPYLIKTDVNDPGTPTTLGNLSVTHEVGIVTNDRILLAYSLMLGLNVFFTSGSDISSLIYFKNESDIPDGDALKDALVALRNSMVTSLEEAFGDKDPATTISAAKQEIVSPGIQEYIKRAMVSATNQIADLFGPKGLGIPVGKDKNTWREEFGSTVGQAAARLFAYNSVVANLGSLRNGYDGMVTGLADAFKDDKDAGEDRRKQFAALNRIISIASNFIRDQEYNKGVLNRLELCSFADSAAKLVFIRTMITKIARTGTDPTGNVKSMVLAMRDDFTQMAESKLFSIQDIINSIPNYGGFPIYKTYPTQAARADETNETLIDTYKAFINAIILMSSRLPVAPAAVAKGGGKTEVDTAYNALRMFRVPVSNGVSAQTDGVKLNELAMAPNDTGKSLREEILKSVRENTRVHDSETAQLEVEREKARYTVAAEMREFEAGGMRPMKGGVFKWAGEDTPVFNNEAVGDDWNGFPVMLNPTPEKQKQFDVWIATYDPVVRMVSAGDGEIPIHRMLKEMVVKSPPFNSPFVKMHINLWAGNGIYSVDPVATLTKVNTFQKSVNDHDTDMKTKLGRIIGRFKPYKCYGLVTRTQQNDVRDLRGRPFIFALCAMLRVLLRIDGRIVHFDLHTRNMARMRDGTPVIHDVGRMKIRDVLAPFAPWEVGRPGTWNKRILRNVLMPIFEWPNYNMDYGQYFYIARFFKELREGKHNTAPAPAAAADAAAAAKPADAIKFKVEKFETPVGPDWVQNDMSADETQKDMFEKWLNVSSGRDGDKLTPRPVHANWVNHSSQKGLRVYDKNGNVVDNKPASGDLFLDPPTETRYHQIARVFDILSVLKALSWDDVKGAVALEPVKTALKIIGLLATPTPTATKANVNKIIRDYIDLAKTHTAYGGNTPEDENAWAIKYLAEVNDARSGKKVPEVAAPVPAPAPAPAPTAAAAAAADAAAAAKDLRDALKARADASAASAAAAGAPLPPDPLNDAIPKQLTLDLAVARAAATVRESKNADADADVLGKRQGVMSGADVVKEAAGTAEVLPTENAPPNIKRLKDPIVFEDGKEEEGEAAARAEPKTGVTYEIDISGNPVPRAGRRTFRRKGLPQLL